MAGKSGGGTSAPKFSVPFLQLDGRSGEFTKVKDKVETKLTAPVEFVILKKRRTISSYKPSLFSTEHERATDKVMLFKKTFANGKTSIGPDSVGNANDLRQANPLLKVHEIVYVLHEGEVCKLEIKSGSIMDYYAFQKSYADQQLHGFQITTSIGSVEAENDSGKYYKIVFSFKESLPEGVTFDEVEAKMDVVNENLSKIDAYTQSRISEKGGASTGSSNLTILTAGESAVIQGAREAAQAKDKEFKEFNDEINPDDIPF